MIFTQKFAADFDAILAATSPFALARWGDGEIAIMDGHAHRSADAWQTRGPVWLRDDLYSALRYSADGYCVGVPPVCCIGGGMRLRPAVRVPREQQCCSTIFLHGNLKRIGELVDRFSDALIVGSWFGDESFRVPPDGVTVPWDLDGFVTRLLAVERPILLAAGPCANVMVWKYWSQQAPEARQTIIDVGSALDVHFGRRTRHYHDTMHKHVCRWTEQDPIEHEVSRRNRAGKPPSPSSVRPLDRRQIRPVDPPSDQPLPRNSIRQVSGEKIATIGRASGPVEPSARHDVRVRRRLKSR